MTFFKAKNREFARLKRCFVVKLIRRASCFVLAEAQAIRNEMNQIDIQNRDDGEISALSSRAKSVFLSAIELQGHRRESYLVESCGDNLTLRARVDSLLKTHQQSQKSVLNLDFGRVMVTEIQSGPADSADDGVGRYELGRELGRGGCAVVYHGTQKSPVTRQVAIKMLRAGIGDQSRLLERFKFEQRAQALMDHPNIAKVLDAGSTAEGQPFLVMEFVEGLRITTYCDGHQLTIRERLELFLDVCNGIQHAHHKGIIHRDIKPSNVLVTTIDKKPVAKVIDFGVAKAVGELEFANADVTQLGQVIGSPAYMSPEQLNSNMDIDTRCDVYSLGMLLFELLSGRLPFESVNLRSINFSDLTELIQKASPQPLHSFSRLDSSGEVEGIAKARKTDARKLRSILRDDLNWIVMKCLEKDRDRRYVSVEGLLLDVRRYLDNAPVSAGPPTTRYRVAKFVQRNRGATIAISLVSASLLLGLVGTSVGMYNADKQWKLAEERHAQVLLEKSRADETVRLMSQTIKNIAIESSGNNNQYRFVLKQSLDDMVRRRLDTGMIESKAAEAEMRELIGEAFLRLRFHDDARTQVGKSIRLIEEVYGNESVQWARLKSLYASVIKNLGKHDEAFEIEVEVYELLKKKLKPGDYRLVVSLGNVAKSCPPDHTDSYYDLAVSECHQHIGGEHHELATSILHNYGLYLWRQKRHAEATQMFTTLLKTEKKFYGESHPRTMRARYALSENLRQSGQISDAFLVAKEMCDIDKKLQQPNARRLLVLANLYMQNDRYKEAINTGKLALNSMDPSKTKMVEAVKKVIEEWESEFAAQQNNPTTDKTGN